MPSFALHLPSLPAIFLIVFALQDASELLDRLTKAGKVAFIGQAKIIGLVIEGEHGSVADSNFLVNMLTYMLTIYI